MSHPHRLVVLGAGGHGKVVVATLDALQRRPDAVYDDDPKTHGTNVLGVPVVGALDDLKGSSEVEAVIGIGAPYDVRLRVVRRLALRWISALHPRAVIHDSAEIGEGTVVFAGAVVQPDAVLGRHVIVNTGATVDHDCEIGDFAHVGPGVHLCGGVTVGAGTLVGVGASVRPGVRIGDGATVGAGSVVVSDVEPEATVVGVPARARPC